MYLSKLKLKTDLADMTISNKTVTHPHNDECSIRVYYNTGTVKLSGKTDLVYSNVVLAL